MKEYTEQIFFCLLKEEDRTPVGDGSKHISLSSGGKADLGEKTGNSAKFFKRRSEL